ncbi:MAG: GTP-binding protein [Polyangiaceae bacterium]
MTEPRGAAEPVPCTLLGGFLGAGKTTLLNHILTHGGQRIAVVVNDFGDVSIDDALIVRRDDTRIVLDNGCICCSVRGDLIEGVRGLLLETPPPQRIVVEMSGIADPGAVTRTFRLMERRWPLQLDGVIAVVDAEHFPEEGAEYYVLARDQLALADLVILNKCDLVAEPELAALESRLRGYVPHARLVRTCRAEVPLQVLLGIGAGRPQGDEETHAGHEFRTHTVRISEALSLEALRRVCTELPASVFRVKGFVFLAERPEQRMVLQIVGRRAQIALDRPWGDEPRQTTLVCVGSRELDASALSSLFASTVAGPAPPTAPFTGAVQWLRRRLSSR